MTLQRVLAAILAALLFAGAIVMGAVLAGLLLGVALVGSLAFMGRIWWLRRRLRKGQPPFPTASAGERPAIDAEFHVVETPRPDSRGATLPPGGDD